MPKIKINENVISGFIPRDAFVNDAKTFISFTVGYDKSYKSQNGEWVNQTAWIPVKLWAKEERISRLADRIKKGVSVVVIGQIDQSNYKDNNGNNVNDVFVRAESIQVYDEGSNNSSSNGGNSGGGYSSQDNYTAAPDEAGDLNFDFLNGGSTY